MCTALLERQFFIKFDILIKIVSAYKGRAQLGQQWTMFTGQCSLYAVSAFTLKCSAYYAYYTLHCTAYYAYYAVHEGKVYQPPPLDYMLIAPTGLTHQPSKYHSIVLIFPDSIWTNV